jgi:hypothetical protein
MNASSDRGYTVTKDGSQTIDTVEILRSEDLFSIEITIFQFKIISEHALGLCSDLIAFCERSGRWSQGRESRAKG